MLHLLLSLSCVLAFADRMEDLQLDDVRLDGFWEQQEQQKTYDRERERAEGLWLEEVEQERARRRRAAEEYRLQKKNLIAPELTADYKKYLQEKKDDAKEYEKTREDYVRKKQALLDKRKQKPHASDEEQLGLLTNRPRFDLAKRTLFNGGGKGGGLSSGRRGGSYSGSAPVYGGGSNSGGFVPPGNFGGSNGEYEGVASDGGFVPPPPPPDDDAIPPPVFDDGEFPPPPPPPDFSDFPPPPPAPDM